MKPRWTSLLNYEAVQEVAGRGVRWAEGMELTRVLVRDFHGHFVHVGATRCALLMSEFKGGDQCYLLEGRPNKAPARLIV